MFTPVDRQFEPRLLVIPRNHVQAPQRPRPLHDDEARSRQMLNEALGDDLRHDLIGVVLIGRGKRAKRSPAREAGRG